MTNQNDAAQAATHEAIRRALELYADCYDTVTRIAQREGREPVVSPVSVAFDIRKNMVNAVIRALSRLRAPVAQPDERAAFEEAYLKITMGKRGGLGRDADGQYGHLMTRALWRGWKARAALASAPVAQQAGPCASCSGMDGDVGHDGSTIDVECAGCRGTGTQPSASAAPQASADAARAIHWPDCWDTTAYPTVESALSEVYATFRCTNQVTCAALDANKEDNDEA